MSYYGNVADLEQISLVKMNCLCLYRESYKFQIILLDVIIIMRTATGPYSYSYTEGWNIRQTRVHVLQ
jgi:hypothetical protein